MIAILSYVAVLAVFSGSITALVMDTGKSMELLKAEMDVQECAAMIDSASSNSGIEFETESFRCSAENGELFSRAGEYEKSETALNNRIEITESGGTPTIILNGRRHYAE